VNPVGFMVWRIGGDARLISQVRWVYEHGFDAVSLHTSVDPAGKRAGIDPEQATVREIEDLRRVLRPFRHVELHAPFDQLHLATPVPDDPTCFQHPLAPTFAFAHRVHARVITVHIVDDEYAGAERRACSRLKVWMQALSSACPHGTAIGFETTRPAYLETIAETGLPNVGLTLDIGHFFLGARTTLAMFHGEIDALVRTYLPATIHFHLHDVRESVDHQPPGRGEVDFPAFFAVVKSGGYRGAFCWELNPDRAAPAEIAAAAEFTRRCLNGQGM